MNPTTLVRNLALAILAAFASLPAFAQHRDLSPSSDGYAIRTDFAGAFTSVDTTGGYVLTRNETNDFDGTPAFLENRGIFEFDISSIPANAVITNVALAAEETSAGSHTSDGPRSLHFYGYSGNGVVETADATAGSLMPLLSGGVNNLSAGSKAVTFDPAVLQSLIGNSSFFGVDTRMDLGYFNYIQLASLETTFFPSAVLTVDYTTAAAATPEPGSMALLTGFSVTGSLCAFRRLRRKR